MVAAVAPGVSVPSVMTALEPEITALPWLGVTCVRIALAKEPCVSAKLVKADALSPRLPSVPESPLSRLKSMPGRAFAKIELANSAACATRRRRGP